jgi:hypothetical protein
VVSDVVGFYIMGLNHGLNGITRVPRIFLDWGGKWLWYPLKPADVETRCLASPTRTPENKNRQPCRGETSFALESTSRPVKNALFNHLIMYAFRDQAEPFFYRIQRSGILNHRFHHVLLRVVLKGDNCANPFFEFQIMNSDLF